MNAFSTRPTQDKRSAAAHHGSQQPALGRVPYLPRIDTERLIASRSILMSRQASCRVAVMAASVGGSHLRGERMRRREFIGLVGGAIIANSSCALAQLPSRVPRIGVLTLIPREAPMPRILIDALRQGLRDLGYVEGQNIALEYWNAGGKFERFPELAAELVRHKVDLIVASITAATRAAQQATTTIPIVCFNLGDPVGEGLIASLARPGGNVTGFSVLGPELMPKSLALLNEAVPKASRVAALLHTGALTDRTTAGMLQQTEAAARTLGIDLQVVRVQAADELDSAFSALVKAGAEALLVFPSPLATNDPRLIADLATRHRLPAISWTRGFAQVGGLMAYGSNPVESWRRGATYVDKILKGVAPAELPVQQPTRFGLVINMQTANALGLTIPPTLLAFADELIE